MITFHFEEITPIALPTNVDEWLQSILQSEGKKEGEINYILCDDSYLLQINRTYLNHDDYTDIITFDTVRGKVISGDIFVSLPRIKENAVVHAVSFNSELLRVLAHGIYHLCGYKDKTPEQAALMRSKEEFAIGRYADFA